jgi:hypothetical protein
LCSRKIPTGTEATEAVRLGSYSLLMMLRRTPVKGLM